LQWYDIACEILHLNIDFKKFGVFWV